MELYGKKLLILGSVKAIEPLATLYAESSPRVVITTGEERTARMVLACAGLPKPHLLYAGCDEMVKYATMENVLRMGGYFLKNGIYYDDNEHQPVPEGWVLAHVKQKENT